MHDDLLDDPPVERPDRTGHARVDAVVDAVAGLDERPLEEHAGVFGAAHDELRRSLDEPDAAADVTSD